MVKQLLQKYKNILSYASISLFVTAIDMSVTWILTRYIHYMIANSMGIICGSTIQYFLNMKKVFKKKSGIKTYAAFAATFLLGFALSNAIYYFMRNFLLDLALSETVKFFIAKCTSMLIPFFAVYFARVYIYRNIIK